MAVNELRHLRHLSASFLFLGSPPATSVMVSSCDCINPTLYVMIVSSKRAMLHARAGE